MLVVAWAGVASASPEGGAAAIDAVAHDVASQGPTPPLAACGPSELSQSKDYPEAMLGIRLTKPTPVQLTAATLIIRCEPDEDSLACTAETTYTLANQAETDAQIRGEYYGASSSYLQMSWAGRRLQLNQFYDDESLAQVNRTAVEQQQPARTGQLDSTFDFTLPASSQNVLSFTSTVTPCQTDRPDTRRATSSSMLQLRHPYFAPRTVAKSVLRYSFELWPVRLWTGTQLQKVKIVLPPQWTAEVRGFPAKKIGPGLLEGEQDGRVADVMVLTLRHSESGPLVNGGPLFAVGGRLDRAQLRFRAGYELGLGEAASTSLVLDHELNRYSTLAWMWELGTHSGPFWPSLTIGAGPLVRLGSGSTAAGGRVQGGLSFKIISFGVSLDIQQEPEPLASFVWGQVSL